MSCAALARGEATSVVGIDLSNGLLALAALGAVGHPRLAWQQGDAYNLPFPDRSFDFVVSGLVLNFAPDRRRMVSEMARVICRGGTVALYVWDHDRRMQPMAHRPADGAPVDILTVVKAPAVRRCFDAARRFVASGGTQRCPCRPL